MREIAHRAIGHREINGDGRAAQFRMRRRSGLRRGKPPEPRNIGSEREDPAVVDVIQHDGSLWPGWKSSHALAISALI